MNRECRYPCLAIIAFGSLFGSQAEPQEEFAGAQLTQCVIDIPVHCSSVEPGGGRVVKCLRDNQAEITPECRRAVASPSDFADATEGLTVSVTIDKFTSRQGSVIVMLSDDAANFPRSARRTVILPIAGATVASAFRRLKPGTFAVSAVHDVNDNGKYDPGEGFVASNSHVSPPSFAASASKIDKSTSVALSMRYP